MLNYAWMLAGLGSRGRRFHQLFIAVSFMQRFTKKSLIVGLISLKDIAPHLLGGYQLSDRIRLRRYARGFSNS